MTIVAVQYDKAEKFLNTCSREELVLTAQQFGIDEFVKREALVSVPKSKEQLVQALIRSEEERHAKERGLLFFNMSEYGKQSFQSESLSDLQIMARYKNVEITYKTYRSRKVRRTKAQLIHEILYYSDFAECF